MLQFEALSNLWRNCMLFYTLFPRSESIMEISRKKWSIISHVRFLCYIGERWNFGKNQAVLCRYLISCTILFVFNCNFFFYNCNGRDFFILLSHFTCVYMRKLSKRRISYKTNITKLTDHESHRYIFSFHFFNIIVSYKKIRFLFKECLADTICAATSFW